MNSLMIALQTMAMLCGPRIQTGGGDAVNQKSKECQVQMLRCVQTKTEAQSSLQKNYEAALSQCVQEIK